MREAEIRANLERVEERLQRACERAGRARAEVQLIAVSKTFPAEDIQAAFRCGLTHFGENRVQEALHKFSTFHPSELKLHLVGHLQSNKVNKVVGLFNMVQSIDRAEVAEKLNRACAERGVYLPVLLQVKLGEEPTKTGMAAEQVESMLRHATSWTNLRVRGLMAIPPFEEKAEASRPYFRQLRQIADSFRGRASERVSLIELSMGMSHDFEIAVEEGATMIRIGTAIFGERVKI